MQQVFVQQNMEWISSYNKIHQELALVLSLSTLVMDHLTRKFQDEIPWRIQFVDDIEKVYNIKLDRCRKAFEKKGFKISCRKMTSNL